MRIDPALVVEAGVAAAGLGVWLLAYWGALVHTRSRPIAAPSAPTQEFGGPESPAVVSLITGRWELTEDAAESTLIDLAARRILEFRQPGNDPLQTTVHVRQEQPSGLNAYESMIFERVKTLAVGGVVPLTALTFRDAEQAKGWNRRLNAAIVADARSRGLSLRRFSPTIVAALTIVAAVPSLALGLAIGLQAAREVRGGDPDSTDGYGAAVVAAIIMWAALGVFAGKSRGERDTPQGAPPPRAGWASSRICVRTRASPTCRRRRSPSGTATCPTATRSGPPACAARSSTSGWATAGGCGRPSAAPGTACGSATRASSRATARRRCGWSSRAWPGSPSPRCWCAAATWRRAWT
ncbi:DUF2207 domain-containing protein [Dactylosporangium darangshiense]|uniref:hypothetical protein n=1 Tax=Dactylosporangium darangshiense TaxID=579108 RepID=UPI00362BAE98